MFKQLTCRQIGWMTKLAPFLLKSKVMIFKLFFRGPFVAIFTFIFSSFMAQSQTNYVLAGATGNGSGSDWGNAFTSLPNTLKRGATYYVGVGTYPSYAFNTADSGTSWVTVKKAILPDHGTSTGWNDSYTNQAVFEHLQVGPNADYLIFDGQTGGGPAAWTNNFGFKIATAANDNFPCIGIGDSGASGLREGNVVIRHVDVQGYNPGGGTPTYYNPNNQGVTIYWSTYNITNSYLYIHGQESNPWQILGAANFVLEYSLIGQWYPQAGDHTEWTYAHVDTAKTIQVTNVVYRYNLFTALPMGAVTGGLVLLVNGAYIYGNVFYCPVGMLWPYCTGGLIGPQSPGPCQNFYIYNNTFINTLGNNSSVAGHDVNCADKGSVFGFGVNGGGNINAANNLFYLAVGVTWGNFATHDYDEYCNLQNQLSSLGSLAEPNGFTNNVNPFKNYANLDFTLNTNTPPGGNLGAPYNVDAFGNLRTTWTRGAYEYVSANTNSANSISLSASSLSFGLGRTNTTQTAIIMMTNTSPGSISGTVTTYAPFTIVAGGTYNLAANGTQSVTVGFTPTGTGAFNSAISFSTSGSTTVTASVSGIGTTDLVIKGIQLPPF